MADKAPRRGHYTNIAKRIIRNSPAPDDFRTVIGRIGAPLPARVAAGKMPTAEHGAGGELRPALSRPRKQISAGIFPAAEPAC